MNQPPYARIAAELRAQIEDGTLAPGARLPSTREIVQRWGVAMATATRVLGALRPEGLAAPIRGVGTVVAGRAAAGGRRPQVPAARPGPGDALTAERIVAAAIAAADTDGLAGLSMRRVAAGLGVATMSLYRHVADKDALVLRMIDTAFRELPFPADPPDGWRPRLELAARALWAMFRRHPWLAQALSVTRPQLLASTLAGGEWMLAALDGYGLDTATMLTAHITLFTYVRGTAAHLEPEANAEADTGLTADAWMDTQVPALRSMLAAGDLPVLSRVTAQEYDFDLDALFEFGLQRLLDGYAVLIEGSRASHR